MLSPSDTLGDAKGKFRESWTKAKAVGRGKQRERCSNQATFHRLHTSSAFGWSAGQRHLNEASGRATRLGQHTRVYFCRLTLRLSKKIRCFSNRRRLPSSASSSESAISER